MPARIAIAPPAAAAVACATGQQTKNPQKCIDELERDDAVVAPAQPRGDLACVDDAGVNGLASERY